MRTAVVTTCLLCVLPLSAQELTDATATRADKHEEKNRNVMLNASSSSKPRDISTGLPGDDGGTAIFEDGVPLATGSWPAYPYFHWAGGAAYSSQTLYKMEETALRSGVVGYAINSRSRLGTDSISGSISLMTSDRGLIHADGAIAGRIVDGWYYSSGVYVHRDPTTVSTPSKKYINDMQVYKLGLTHRWADGQGEVSLLYKLSVNHDGAFGYTSAPFYYKGNGKIERYQDFRLGRDCYMPEDDRIEYLDVETGKMVSNRLGQMHGKTFHDLTAFGYYDFNNNWKLRTSLHVSGAKDMDNLGIFESGIDELEGQLLQNRLTLLVRSDYLDVMGDASLRHISERHETELGAGLWTDYQFLRASTFMFAHTVEPNPVRIARNGRRTWGYNEATEYYRGREYYASLYAIDDWQVSHRLNLYYGARLELMHNNADGLANADDSGTNALYDGFYIGDGKTHLNKFRRNCVNVVGLANLSYRIFNGLFLSGEYLYASKHKTSSNYAMPDIATMKPSVKQLVRTGISVDHSWFSLTSMLSYINGRNNVTVLHLTKQIGGVSENLAYVPLFNIGTWGWTTDLSTKLPHWNLHLLATLQSPKYANFRNELSFSDGSTEVIDYSGNYVSGMSKLLLEIDPSWQNERWRVWLSARYFSRQYANRVNNAYFAGHWETFGGVDYHLNPHLTLSLNAVNLLNQTGVSGTLDALDTITDDSLLQNYLTSGTYIRPFTVNASVTYAF